MQFGVTNAYFKHGFGGVVAVLVIQIVPVPPKHNGFVTFATKPVNVPVAVTHCTIVDVQPLQSVTKIV